jgi:hypothetical protein
LKNERCSKKKHCGQEHQKERIVPLTYAVVQNSAMMVKSQDAISTITAVRSLRRTPNITRKAEDRSRNAVIRINKVLSLIPISNMAVNALGHCPPRDYSWITKRHFQD